MNLMINSILGGILGTLLCWTLFNLAPSITQKKFFLKFTGPVNLLVAVALNVVDVHGKLIAPLFS